MNHISTPLFDDPPSSRPAFTSAQDFALWALNAPEYEVPMALKVKIASALLRAEGKRGATALAPIPDIFRPRVR